MTGRGKGLPTMVPERALIDQVKIRPLLYDKAMKDYRKPEKSDAAWMEVAQAIGTTVCSCKKRWKSLRDTFIKYYRLESLYKAGESQKRPKEWNYYLDCSFLKKHVELFRLDSYDSLKKEDMTDNERIRFFDEQEDEGKVEYEIRIAPEEYTQDPPFTQVKQDHLLESYVEHPEPDGEYDVEDHDHEEKVPSDEYLMHEDSHKELEDSQVSDHTFQSSKFNIQNVCHVEEPPPPVNVPLNPDETYWLSRFEAVKRLTRKQQAFVRMGFEKLLYEAEFENDDESQTKRNRMS